MNARTWTVAGTMGAVALAMPAGAQTIVNSWSTNGLFAGGVDAFGGVVWVVDETADEIQCFDASGNPIQSVPSPTDLPIGAGYDPMRDTLWIGDESEICIEVDASTGVPTGVQFDTTPAVTDVSGVAVDPVTGNVFVSQDSAPQRIVEFDRTGAVLRTIPLAAAGSTDPDGLAYNPLTQTFLTGEDLGDLVLEVDGAGNLVGSWDLGALGVSPEGLGLNLAAGTVYIGDGAGATVYEVAGILKPATTFVLTGLAPVEIPFSQDDFLRVYPITRMQPVALGRLPSAQIPSDPSLLGLHAYWQVLRYDPQADPANPVRSSNGLDFEFGGDVVPYGRGSGLRLRSLQPTAPLGSWTAAVVTDS